MERAEKQEEEGEEEELVEDEDMELVTKITNSFGIPHELCYTMAELRRYAHLLVVERGNGNPAKFLQDVLFFVLCVGLTVDRIEREEIYGADGSKIGKMYVDAAKSLLDVSSLLGYEDITKGLEKGMYDAHLVTPERTKVYREFLLSVCDKIERFPVYPCIS